MFEPVLKIMRLNSADLGQTPLRRARGVPERKRGDGSDAGYDRTTLWYDAVYRGGQVHLVCPPLLNLKQAVRRAEWRVDGARVAAPRIRSFYRHAILTLPAPRGAARIDVQGPDWQVAGPVAQPETLFDGLNCEMLISRDNRLDWIEQKLRNHVDHHGLEGVLFFDNGSREYGPEAVLDVLGRVGLKVGVVVPVPLPWGRVNKPGYMHRELYLQTGVYNVARLRFLAQARAVLRMDIDETLVPHPDGTVFDAAQRSLLGYVQVNGRSRYPAPGETPPFRFADHTYRLENDKLGGGNWCLVPDGPLRRHQWRCHNLEGFPLTVLSRRRGCWYYDCQGITTGWKDPTRWAPEGALVFDPEAAAFFEGNGSFSGE